MITLDEIRAAYARTGLKPGCKAFMTGGYACPIAAVLVDRFGLSKAACLDERCPDALLREGDPPDLDVYHAAARELGMTVREVETFTLRFDGFFAQPGDNEEAAVVAQSARRDLDPKDLSEVEDSE